MAGPVFVLQIVLLRWGRKHLLPRAVGCGSLPRTAVTVADAAAAQQCADYLKAVLSAAPILGTEYATLQGNLLLRVSGKPEPVRRRPVQSSVHRLTGQPSSAPDHNRWGARFRWSAENRCGRCVVGRAMGVPGVCPY